MLNYLIKLFCGFWIPILSVQETLEEHFMKNDEINIYEREESIYKKRINSILAKR